VSYPQPQQYNNKNKQSYNNGGMQIRVNNRIRAREVRVIDGDGKMLGVLPLQDAMNAAKARGVDLVEISPNANPPVCKLVEIGKYRYDAAKKSKEAKKKQNNNKLKEIQLRPGISERDFQVKLDRAISFFCNDMKVKLVLRFKGREMQHKEFGFQIVNDFIEQAKPFATNDSAPKIIGKGINVMLSPLPKNKRAKNPKGDVNIEQIEAEELEDQRRQGFDPDEDQVDEETVEVSQTKPAPVKKVKKTFEQTLLEEFDNIKLPGEE